MAKQKKSNSFVQKRSKYFIIAAVALVVLIGGSYAWLTLAPIAGTKTNVIKAGTLALTLDETSSNGITIPSAVPMTDATGEGQNGANDVYKFSLKNEGDIDAVYTIYFDNDAITEGKEVIPDDFIKYQLKKDAQATTATLLSMTPEGGSARVVDTGTIAAGDTIDYELRLWINQDATSDDVSGKEFAGKIRIEASQTGIEPGV